MPRMQVYLPEAMYEQVKARGLRVPEILQRAVRVELRELHLLAEANRYLTDLIAEVGAPSAALRARAGVALRVALDRRDVRETTLDRRDLTPELERILLRVGR